MPVIDKLLSLATVGSAVANTTLLPRLVSGLTGILALTVIAALMGGTLLISGFYAIYIALVSYGLDTRAAAVTVALLIFVTMAITLCLLVIRVRHLKELSHYEIRRDLPGLSQVIKVAEAFMEGLLTPRKEHND